MRYWIAAAFCVAVCGFVSMAPAAMLNTVLGNSGWMVSSADQRNVNVFVDGEGIDGDGRKFVVLEIAKTFRLGPDPQTGVIPSINMCFTQLQDSPGTFATRFFIADESITNLTGKTWDEFYWILFGQGSASFNQTLSTVTSNPTATGWQINPFTTFSWVSNPGTDIESLNVAGGVVPNNGAFFPGSGQGNLVIDIVGNGGSFVLKELPSHWVPEPASISMLILGGLTLLRRRAR